VSVEPGLGLPPGLPLVTHALVDVVIVVFPDLLPAASKASTETLYDFPQESPDSVIAVEVEEPTSEPGVVAPALFK
jgi:hypothetical protein